MCHVLKIRRSGFYDWLKQSQSQRSKDDNYLLGFIKQFWLESGCVYGYLWIYKDLRASGDQYGRNLVLRLIRKVKIQSQRGYKRQHKHHAGEVSTIAPNLLNREFNVVEPNKVWVTDITYARTQQGRLSHTIVVDLFSWQVVGWSMSKKIDTDLALDALTIACWRRNPKHEVIVYSDQGCQYTGYDWRSMRKTNNLTASMSRRENCWDNVCAETFFGCLKRERIRRKVYATRDEGRADIFNYIEMFWNSVRWYD